MVCFKDLEIGDFFLDTEHDFSGIKISENMYFNRKTKKIYHTILGDIYIFKKCDPENTRPHGEWMITDCERDILHVNGKKYTCSICGVDNCYGKPPFCMWCGADMRGEIDHGAEE